MTNGHGMEAGLTVYVNFYFRRFDHLTELIKGLTVYVNFYFRRFFC